MALGLTIWDLVIVAFGLAYIIWPNMFRRWVWTETSIAQRLLSPQKYALYMRSLGVIIVLIGISPAIKNLFF